MRIATLGWLAVWIGVGCGPTAAAPTGPIVASANPPSGRAPARTRPPAPAHAPTTERGVEWEPVIEPESDTRDRPLAESTPERKLVPRRKLPVADCPAEGDVVYRETRVSIRAGDKSDGSDPTVLEVRARGHWRLSGGTIEASGCLSKKQVRAVTRAIARAKFTGKRAKVRCRAVPNTTFSLQAGKNTYSFSGPCGETPHKTLSRLMKLLDGYTGAWNLPADRDPLGGL